MDGYGEYCNTCRKAHPEAAKECKTCRCRLPALLPENRPAWQLWMVVHTQWRTSLGGLLGIDYTAVHCVAETLGVEMIPATLSKIKALESWTLRHEREQQK